MWLKSLPFLVGVASLPQHLLFSNIAKTSAQMAHEFLLWHMSRKDITVKPSMVFFYMWKTRKLTLARHTVRGLLTIKPAPVTCLGFHRKNTLLFLSPPLPYFFSTGPPAWPWNTVGSYPCGAGEFRRCLVGKLTVDSLSNSSDLCLP